MTTFPIPEAALTQHMAILGKTGSGKTSTEKLIVEHVVASDFRVCVLVTTKSDWWGITSSASGKREGLPFKILGGPRGHVPLHSSAGKVIGQLVGSGKLPLSIIDMADFEAGGLQRFFVDFAPALMRHARGVIYLVIEEAHELAPKERAGFGAESMAIHWAKKLATAGRSKGLRMIVATQRVQALHNAVLGSCETLIAHRLTTPADQEPVIKWLKANVDKDTLDQVSGTLSSLPTGTGWVCSGEAKISEMVRFPKFKTYDNTATPTGDGTEIDVKTALVDHDELRSIIGDAVKEAEANDPRLLKAEIAQLRRQVQEAAAAAAKLGQAPDPKAIAAAEQAAYSRGKIDGYADAVKGISAEFQAVVAALDRAEGAFRDVRASAAQVEEWAKRPAPAVVVGRFHLGATPQPKPKFEPNRQPPPPRAMPSAGASGNGTLSAPLQKIVDAIAWWNALGHDRPTSAQVGFVANYKPRGGSWDTYRSRLKSAGLIEYLPEGRIRLTVEGIQVAHAPATPPTVQQFHDAVRALLDTPLLKLLDPLLDVYPNSLDSEAWGERAWPGQAEAA